MRARYTEFCYDCSFIHNQFYFLIELLYAESSDMYNIAQFRKQSRIAGFAFTALLLKPH